MIMPTKSYLTNKEVITSYRDTVYLLHCTRLIIDWNIRHGLPVRYYTKDAEQLKNDLLRYDDLVNRIEDREARNVINCRFALGMSIEATAEYMNTSTEKINRLTSKAWKIINTDIL